MPELSPALEALYAARRPVGPVDVYRAWVLRAAELGLHAGELADVPLAAFRAGLARSSGPYARSEVAALLHQLEGSARRRRPRWQVVRTDAGVVLVHDPDGGADNLAAALEELRYLAAAERRSFIVASVEAELASPDRPTLEALATRWAIHPATLRRWRRAERAKQSADARPRSEKRSHARAA